VLNRYIAKKGAFAGQLSTHVPNIGKGILAANKNFHQLLKQAGERDPLMAEAPFPKALHGQMLDDRAMCAVI
jgi:hypothetical protein